MRIFAVAVITALSMAWPAAAQTPVSTADIQRLQDSVSQAANEVSQMRRDSALAGRLQGDIDELREEVIYLKVKLRKERSVPRADYADVRDRIDDVRSRATSGTSTSSNAPRSIIPAAPAPVVRGNAAVEIPVGTELDVRLSDRLNSGTSKVEDRFEGTTIADLLVGGRNVIPAGSVMRGVVTDVEPATRTNRTGKMTVSFDQMTINGRAYPIRATVTEAMKAGAGSEVAKAGIGTAAGAIIGGILGGGKGAVIGAVVGGGGTMVATEGKEVDIPQGTTLRMRFDSPLTLR